ncbi:MULTISPECIES: T9SS sorting signal type C domain-containing protein [unclassified Flavobacterium]|uniref:T9SS sorting signal type C domain-containing protein n=1 Tax=unclassified Flavobacterium TaxID=196869 RepID=UPI001F13A14D|nr:MULTISPECIES: T9SS sorting signal type C domain-containing protein [unclassified Flavobacterium]UMY66871.1 T9SS sorting signal type C domain-containing protein [Flavobacterium sp. HJ-32-4]
MSVPAFESHSLVVYKDTDAVLTLDADASLINTVRIFDSRGRLVYTQPNLNTTVTKLRDLKPAAQVLLVQITSNDGRVVTKKVAY